MKAAPRFSRRHYCAGIIGNILENYDMALFGFLAPFLSPLFFSNQDPLTGLILTYAIMPLGILARPLGALVFGWIGDVRGRKQALCLSLGLMAVATAAIGLLPTFATAGIWAPVLLALFRGFQGFCKAGETSGGAIFVLEETRSFNKSLISSFYNASSIVGILLACGGVAWMAECGGIEKGWRYLYFAGASTAVVGLFLRMSVVSDEKKSPAEDSLVSLKQLLGRYLPVLCAIACAAGFGFTTYSQAVTLMHGYVPLITSFTKAEVMHWNTYLLVLDLCLLPCFGYLAARLSKETVMLSASFLSAVFAIPLFLMLSDASLVTLLVVRASLIALGVAFSAPLYAWMIELVPRAHRYTLISLGMAIGSQVIGSPGPAISLWIFQKTGWVFSPALYLMMTAVLGFIAVLVMQRTLQQIRSTHDTSS